MVTKRSREVERTIQREKDVLRFSQNIERWLFQNLSETLDGVNDRNYAALEKAKILGSLQDSMRQAGLDKELAKLQRLYGEDLQAIATALRPVRVQTFTELDRPMLDALIKGGYDQAGALITKYVSDVREVVGFAVLAGKTPDIRKIVDDEGQALRSRLETEINTSMSAFHRVVTLTKAQELGFDLFEYVGPLDQVTREFCEDILTRRDPPIYTSAEIAGLYNEQGLPVAQYGGGYNCRHSWEPIDEEEARARGWEPGN